MTELSSLMQRLTSHNSFFDRIIEMIPKTLYKKSEIEDNSQEKYYKVFEFVSFSHL